MIFLLGLLVGASGELFVFRPTSTVSSTENWLHSESPCVGDRMRFDDTHPVLAFVDHNVDVESITLPSNGMLVFSDSGVSMGGDNKWQCAKGSQGEPKDTFFLQDGDRDTSYYNPSNWKLDEQPFLHMNQVPSEHDDVVVSSLTSAQIYLDLPVFVNSFSLYHRTRMTTEDFNVLLRSMEGQFQFILARPWARESDVGGVQRMLADDAITVRNKNLGKVLGGRVNPNSRNETLAAICAYVHCEPIENKCVDPFLPFGHCCPVCGGKIEVIAWEMDFEAAKTRVSRIVEELAVREHSFVSMERKTMNPLASRYEIALAMMSNGTFDEQIYATATRRIIDELALSLSTNHQRSVLDFTIHLSKIDRTIRTVSKVVACLIYFSVVICLTGLYAYKNLELRVSRRDIFNPTIKYKRQTDEVTIELEDMSGQTAELEDIDEDVEDRANVNPNFEENETTETEYSHLDDTQDTIPAVGEQELISVDEDPCERISSESERNEEATEDVACDVKDLDSVNPNFGPLETFAGKPEDSEEEVLKGDESGMYFNSAFSETSSEHSDAIENDSVNPNFDALQIVTEESGERPATTLGSSEASQETLQTEKENEEEEDVCPTPPPGDIQLIDF